MEPWDPEINALLCSVLINCKAGFYNTEAWWPPAPLHCHHSGDLIIWVIGWLSYHLEEFREAIGNEAMGFIHISFQLSSTCEERGFSQIAIGRINAGWVWKAEEAIYWNRFGGTIPKSQYNSEIMLPEV